MIDYRFFATLLPLVLQLLGFHTALGHTALSAKDVPGIPDGEVRYSTLRRDYLERTNNVDVAASRDISVSVPSNSESSKSSNSVPSCSIPDTGSPREHVSREAGTQSPTDLAVLAAGEALRAAAISAEQIGLVIGDGQTPWQVTPSEGQRVADRLGLKVPAYDLAGGGIAPVQLAMLNRWKPSRLPDYALLITAACPTQRIDSLLGAQKNGALAARAAFFSDSATAAVVSMKHRGVWSVLDGECSLRPSATHPLVIDQFAPIAFSPEPFSHAVEQLCGESAARAIFKNKLHGARVALAMSEAGPGMAERVASGHSIHRWAASFERVGYCFGSSCFVALADLARTSSPGDRVIVTQALPGFTTGFIVLERN